MVNVSIRKEPIHSRSEMLAPEPTRTRGQQLADALRRRRRLILAILIPLFIVWLIPILIAHSPLINSILGSAGAGLKGTATARSASLGWFSGVWLGGVEIRDEHDQVVMEIPEVTGNRSLLGLLWNSQQLGRFKLREPKLHVVVREGGSNVEDLLAEYLHAKRAAPRDVDVEIIDGTIALGESKSAKPWQIEKFQLSFRMPLDQRKPIEVSVAGSVPEAKSAGQFALDLTVGRAADKAAKEAASAAVEASLKTDALPLAMFNAILGRLASQTQLEGRASSSLQCQWNSAEAPNRLTVRGNVEADRFALSAAALGTDQLQLQKLRANCQFAWQDGWILIDQFVADSDVGNTSLAGLFQWNNEAGQNTWKKLRRQNYELQGKLDLTRLAKMLPNTLRIRKGTQITSGQLSLAINRQQAAEGMIWQGRVETTNLTAVNGEKRLVWEQPLLVTLSGREGEQGPVLDSLKCESSFLKISVAGTRDQLNAAASFDLNRLANQLNGFVDLGSTRLAGDGWANFTWKRSKDRGGFEADGDLQVRSLQLALPNRPVWTEDNVTMILSATGRTDFTEDSRLDEAVLKFEAGPDRVEARLLQPVVGFRRGGTWAVDLRALGQIARWMPRVGIWTTLADWNASGSYDLQGQVTYSPDAIRFNRVRLALGQLMVTGPWLNVREPMAEVLLSGRYTQADRRLEAEQASLATNNLALQATNLLAAWPVQGPPELQGAVNCQGSLEQVQQWFTRPGAAPKWQFAGQLAAKAEFRQTNGTIASRFDTSISNLTAAHYSGRKFQEPLLHLEGRSAYDRQGRTLELQQVKLTSGALSGNANGRIVAAASLRDLPAPGKLPQLPPMAADAADAQLAGQLDYDMEKLSRLIQSYTGGNVYFAGRHSSAISYRGPFRLDGGQASAAIKWNWGDVFGFRVDAGELQFALDKGTLQIRPAELAVSEGKVFLAPQVRLNVTPVELWLPPGKLIEQVRINPVMCAGALQYVAPVLAGITNIEGRFSVELQSCRIPLGDPAKSDVAGKMTLHSAQVSPGPLIQEFSTLLSRAAPAQLNREGVLEFRVVEGRVYHRGLELVFPDVTIRTYGSVGLDDSLAMVAEMPIPPKWQENKILAAALKDKVLRLPIGGTLQRPKLDRTVLDQISRQFLQTATRSVIDNALNQQLNRLLPPAPAGSQNQNAPIDRKGRY